MRPIFKCNVRWFRALTVCLVVILGGSTLESSAAPTSRHRSRRAANSLDLYRGQHQKIRRSFTENLGRIARYCEENGYPEAANRILKEAAEGDFDAGSVAPLPSTVQREIRADLPIGERQWRNQLRKAKRVYAAKVYALSRRALKARHPSYGYSLVREAAHYNPDHANARRILGFVKLGKEWLRPFAAKMKRQRYVSHEKFGWIRKSHVERYEKGQRYFNGKWISAEKENVLRSDFKSAWQIRTEHYLIKTNHSLERGVEIGKLLEEYHTFFMQTFAAFFNTANKKLHRKPHVIHYYRSRDEYNERLIKKIPLIAITNGLFYTTDRVAYFFHDPNRANDQTLYHEATHQLFYEHKSRDRMIAEHGHFWITEGIACYMESYRNENGRISLGNPRHQRIVAARYRYLNDGYYVPLGRFAAMGLKQFQNDKQNISRNYSQASGLAHFFMHYDNGKYRDHLIEHLSQIYGGGTNRRMPVESLPKLTGVSSAELDRQYGEYLEQMEKDLRAARQ